MKPGLRGAAFAGMVGLRVQLAIVYLSAASTKLMSEGWPDGMAVRAAVLDPVYGLPPFVLPDASLLTGPTTLVRALTWSVITVEFAIAGLLLASSSIRRWSFALVCVLHVPIIFAMGLPSFGTIMIAVNAIAQAGDRSDNRRFWSQREPSHRPLRR
jgi:hypothetical protein